MIKRPASLRSDVDSHPTGILIHITGIGIFQKAGCPGWHSGPYYTGMNKHNVGTGKGREKGIAFDTLR
ncbi:MAG: hypothetical protein ACXVJU_13375 [Candidatus Angelobacter sp.]